MSAQAFGPQPAPEPEQDETRANKEGVAAVNGFLMYLSALLPLTSLRVQRIAKRIASLKVPAQASLQQRQKAQKDLDKADKHLSDTPVRLQPWSSTSFLLAALVLAVCDYFGLNAVMRAGNLPPITSYTLPSVVSVVTLTMSKMICAWHLGSVAKPTSDPDVLPRSEQPQDKTRLAQQEKILVETQAVVDQAKRRAFALVLPLMVVSLLGVGIGLSVFSAGLLGSGLDDGNHEMLLLTGSACFGIGVFGANATAAFALAYSQYVAGAGAYRAAVRAVQVKGLYLRVLSITSRASRRSSGLIAVHALLVDKADIRGGLGVEKGVSDVLGVDADGSSRLSADTVARLTDTVEDNVVDLLQRRRQRIAEDERDLGGTPAGGDE